MPPGRVRDVTLQSDSRSHIEGDVSGEERTVSYHQSKTGRSATATAASQFPARCFAQRRCCMNVNARLLPGGETEWVVSPRYVS